LRENIISRSRDTHEKVERRELPYKVGLVDGFMLLMIINPRYMENLFASMHTMNQKYVLDKFRGVTSTRNSSILAHGISPLGETEYNALNQLALKLAEAYGGDKIINMITSICPPTLEEE